MTSFASPDRLMEPRSVESAGAVGAGATSVCGAVPFVDIKSAEGSGL